MALWEGENPLILASQSHTRKMLLANAGLDFEAIPAGLDERRRQDLSNLSDPREIALMLAREKALAVSKGHRSRYVVGADQTLALGDRLLSKPANRAAAFEQLKDLAGKCHELHSAFAVVRDGKLLCEDATIARLTMRALTEEQINVYLDTSEHTITSSVGAYQLEKFGIHLFDAIDGDHFTILGLPLLPLLAFLRREKLLGI